jgi:hypothetical protein
VYVNVYPISESISSWLLFVIGTNWFDVKDWDTEKIRSPKLPDADHERRSWILSEPRLCSKKMHEPVQREGVLESELILLMAMQTSRLSYYLNTLAKLHNIVLIRMSSYWMTSLRAS